MATSNQVHRRVQTWATTLVTCVVALVLVACSESNSGAGGSSKASASAPKSGAAAQSGAPAGSAANLPPGAKPRVAHEMKGRDQCLAEAPSEMNSGLVTAEELVWPNGSVVKIGFLDGRPEQIATVVKEASEWMKYANIKFEWHTDPANPPKDADELVTFSKCGDRDPSWFVRGPGPHARRYAKKGEFSICLSAMDPEWNGGPQGQAHAIASIKHEFGHVLGLMHEQFNPDLKVTWDKDYVYQWCKKTQNWDKDNCDAQVMQTIEDIDPKARWRTTKFDKDSIMYYGINDPNFTTERVVHPQPLTISEMDKKAIGEIYPGADPSKEPAPTECKPGDASCGTATAPPPATGTYKIGTASKKLKEEDGKVVWFVAVGLDEGDTSKVAGVVYQFPRQITSNVVKGDTKDAQFIAKGSVPIDPDIAGFKVRARIDLKDGTTAVAEVVLKLGEDPTAKEGIKDVMKQQ